MFSSQPVLEMTQPRGHIEAPARYRRSARAKAKARRIGRKLVIEALEPRTLLSTVSWAVNSSGYWDVPTNWSTGSLPGPGDDVVIDKPGVTVTYRTGSSTIHSLDDQDAFVLSGGTLTASTTLQVKGSFSLAGGTLSSTSVLGTTTIQATTSGGTLAGVTLAGNLDLATNSGSANVTVTGGLTLDGTISLGNASGTTGGQLNFVGAQTLSGTGSVVFGGFSQGGNLITTAARGGDSGTLTIGPDITIHGKNGLIGNSTLPLINQGTIDADVQGGSLVVVGSNWTNSATLQATAGSLSLNGTWTSTGSISASSGGVYLGGSFSLGAGYTIGGSGGRVEFDGTLGNDGTTLTLNDAALTYVLNGGTITGGTVAMSNGAVLMGTSSGGTLDGVTLEGNLNLTAFSSHVTILNGLTLDGFVQVGSGSTYYGYLDFVGTQSLSGTGSIRFDNSTVNTVRVRDSGTTLTIGPGITIHGANGSVGYNPLLSGSHNDVAVIDHGTVSPDFAGGTIILRADNGFTATGLKASGGGTLNLTGTFALQGSAFLESLPGGTISVSGDLVGGTRDADLFKPLGQVLMNGNGTAAAPQRLEVMSQDLRAGRAALTKNFAYGTLSLGPNTYVLLVDDSDNSSGSGAEALYVNALVVPLGSTLALNGLHVYAHTTQIAGTVVGGTITQLQGGGEIGLGAPAAGDLLSPTTGDDWTFFGRAS